MRKRELFILHDDTSEPLYSRLEMVAALSPWDNKYYCRLRIDTANAVYRISIWWDPVVWPLDSPDDGVREREREKEKIDSRLDEKVSNGCVESVDGKIKFPRHLVISSLLIAFACFFSNVVDDFKMKNEILPAGHCRCTDSYVQNKRCHCHDQIRCWMLMCTSQNRRHRRSSACITHTDKIRWLVLLLRFRHPLTAYRRRARTKQETAKKWFNLRAIVIFEIRDIITASSPSDIWVFSVCHRVHQRSHSFVVKAAGFYQVHNRKSTLTKREAKRDENENVLFSFCVVSWWRHIWSDSGKYEPIRKIFPRVRHTKVEPLRVFVRV